MEVVKSYSVDLSVVEIKDLGGNITVDPKEVGRALGESVYAGFVGLGWFNVAQAFFKGTSVDMSEVDIAELLAFIESKRCGIVIMVKIPLIAYFENLIK